MWTKKKKKKEKMKKGVNESFTTFYALVQRKNLKTEQSLLINARAVESGLISSEQEIERND